MDVNHGKRAVGHGQSWRTFQKRLVGQETEWRILSRSEELETSSRRKISLVGVEGVDDQRQQLDLISPAWKARRSPILLMCL
jgi:hypothetical protein